MLLIDDDQPEVLDGAEDRRSGADGDPGFSVADLVPGIEPLSIGEAVVEDRDLFLEAPFEPFDHLGGEGDLGDEEEDPFVKLEGMFDRLEVNLRLAASCDAVDEPHFKTLGGEALFDFL